MGSDASIAEQFGALAELRQQGLIRHLGLSGVTDAQRTEAQAIAPVVTVRNLYSLANRADDALVDRCAEENIAAADLELTADTLAELDAIGR
ncbi:aldo/keto reductase [Streptomyces sp. CRN 30]|uniref:aldo/keto reductase n=1 Tax=Streptomyces sp. CRN 30 TaxID=3075613 RepID=UPI0039C4950F